MTFRRSGPIGRLMSWGIIFGLVGAGVWLAELVHRLHQLDPSLPWLRSYFLAAMLILAGIACGASEMFFQAHSRRRAARSSLSL